MSETIQLSKRLTNRRAPSQVLIVEDNSADALMMQGVIDDVGIPSVVAVAKDGNTAIQMASTVKFDLAIVDLALPGLPGLATAKFLRTNALVFVIVICTGVPPESPEWNEVLLADFPITRKPLNKELVARLLAKTQES